MTATMNSIRICTTDSNTELASVQTEINKVIYYHQLLLLKDNKKSNVSLIESIGINLSIYLDLSFYSKQNGVKSKLKAYEKKLEQLSERQKVVLNDLRKERLNASNLESSVFKQVNFQSTGANKQFLMQNQPKLLRKPFLNAQQDKQQIKSFTGQKLLLPNEQMYVISTPGGGARLVTTSSNPSRSTLTKSFTATDKSNNGFTNTTSANSLLNNNISSANKTTQYNNFTITNTTKPLTATTLTTSLNLQNSKVSNDKANHLLPVELLTNSNLNKRKSAIQPLVDKHDQQQSIKQIPGIQEQQPEPPKIDEAKAKEEYFASLGLVTKKALSEIQNKKSERKRRTTANPQFSSAAIEAKRISALETAAKKAKKRELAASNQNNKILNNQQQQGNKRVFLNSNRGKAVGKPDNKRSGYNNNNNNKVLNNKQSNNQTLNSGIKISPNCFVCEEVCDSDYDAIMFCTDCQCLFHATCSSTVDKIKEAMGVPCPKCATKRPLNDELNNFNENSNEADLIQNQAKQVESNSSSSSVISNNRVSSRRKLNQSKNSKVISNKLNSSNEQAKGNNNKVLGELSKSESKLDEEKNRILMKHIQVNKQIREFRQKLALLKDKVYISKENRKEMLTKKEDSIKSIDSILNLVRRIQEQTIEQKENRCELVGKLNNELNNKLNDNLADKKNTAPIDNLITVIENSAMNELNDVASETIINEDSQPLKSENNVDEMAVTEAVTVLSNLSTLNNDESSTHINSQQTDNLVKKENTVELTDKEKVLMQDYTEVEKEVIQNLINYSNSTIENQLHETAVVVVSTQQHDELQIEPLNGEKISQINNNQIENDKINDNQIPDVSSTDEPPVKKQRISPLPSPHASPLDRKMNTVEDVIMNEIDLAIASIPN